MLGNPYAAEIETGVTWLDANIPDWVQAFAEDKAAGLHMEDCDRCVLGYVLGSFYDRRSPAYSTGTVLFDEQMRIAASMGFMLRPSELDDEKAWAELGAGWQELIGKRLADAGLLA